MMSIPAISCTGENDTSDNIETTRDTHYIDTLHVYMCKTELHISANILR